MLLGVRLEGTSLCKDPAFSLQPLGVYTEGTKPLMPAATIFMSSALSATRTWPQTLQPQPPRPDPEGATLSSRIAGDRAPETRVTTTCPLTT